MHQERKFVLCEICGNIAGLIHDTGVPMMCCGQEMEELKTNAPGGAAEKHVPVVSKDGQTVTVTVGSAAHPMTSDHAIDWIYLQTKQGGQRKKLKSSQAPTVQFLVTKDDCPVIAYAYCNLHGFWKSAEIK